MWRGGKEQDTTHENSTTSVWTYYTHYMLTSVFQRGQWPGLHFNDLTYGFQGGAWALACTTYNWSKVHHKAKVYCKFVVCCQMWWTSLSCFLGNWVACLVPCVILVVLCCRSISISLFLPSLKWRVEPIEMAPYDSVLHSGTCICICYTSWLHAN